MASFAEIDSTNKVLRVLVACDVDVANNGGDQSEQAAEHFKSTIPLSINGVKWVQTSKTNSFRKRFAGIGSTYDAANDRFINPKPYASWTLDGNGDWQAPTPRPEGFDPLYATWDDDNQTWVDGS